MENNINMNAIINERPQLKSAPLLLSAIQKEYDVEHDKSKQTDTRVGIFVSLLSAVCMYVRRFYFI